MYDICRDVCRHFDVEGYEHEDNMTFLRRSTRQRKFQYGTFNQNLMLDVPVSSLGSVESDKPDEGEKDAQQQNEAVQQSDAEVTACTDCGIQVIVSCEKLVLVDVRSFSP